MSLFTKNSKLSEESQDEVKDTSKKQLGNVANLKAAFENRLQVSPNNIFDVKKTKPTIKKRTLPNDKGLSNSEESLIDNILDRNESKGTKDFSKKPQVIPRKKRNMEANDKTIENIDKNKRKEIAEELSRKCGDFLKPCVDELSKEKFSSENVVKESDKKDDISNDINQDEIMSIIIRNRASDKSATNVEALTEKNQRHLSNVVLELVSVEKGFVDGLEKGISNYVNSFNRHVRNYPAALGKKYHIFSNIERLFVFHKEIFLPALIECNNDIISIATLFYTYFTKNYFYGHLQFGLNKTRAEKLSVENKKLFENIMTECGDTLGVISFLMKPIQLLPRYKLLFDEIIEALAKDNDAIQNVKDIVNACCIVEKQIQKFVSTINEALCLNDIEEAYKIDLWEQGKFKKMDEFEVIAYNRFRGKIFLFEEMLLCTEIVEKSSILKIRTYILLNDVKFINTDNKSSFIIFTKNNQETFFISTMLVVQEWTKLLLLLTKKRAHLRFIKTPNFLSRNMSFVQTSGSESNLNTLRRNKWSSSSLRVTKSEEKLHQTPFGDGHSNSNSYKREQLSGSSQDSNILENITRNANVKDLSTDYQKYLENLCNIEKHFILLLTIHHKGYVENIPT